MSVAAPLVLRAGDESKLTALVLLVRIPLIGAASGDGRALALLITIVAGLAGFVNRSSTGSIE